MPTARKRRRGTRRPTKDRVLQARIPELLDEELRNRADQLGMSVSTIVRNVLLNTFDLVEGVVTDSSQIARVLMDGDAGGSTPHTEPAVIGWQEAILNRNGVCEQCNTILPRGQRAAVGVPTGPRAVLLCLDCLSTLSANTEEVPCLPASVEKQQPASKRKPAGQKKKD